MKRYSTVFAKTKDKNDERSINQALAAATHNINDLANAVFYSEQIDQSWASLVQNALPEPTIWTPTLIGSVTPGAQTYSIQNGLYWKLGKFVFIQIYITITAKDAAAAGNALVSNLPFVPRNLTNYFSMLGATQYSDITFPAGGYTQLSLVVIPGTASMRIAASGSALATTLVTMPGIGNNTLIRAMGIYFTDD